MPSDEVIPPRPEARQRSARPEAGVRAAAVGDGEALAVRRTLHELAKPVSERLASDDLGGGLEEWS